MPRLSALLLAAALGGACAPAIARNDDATDWVTLASTASGSFNRILLGDDTVTYGPVAALGVRFYDGNPDGGQSADAIRTLIAQQFPVASGTLQLTSQLDSGAGFDENFSLSNAPSFNYLALHFGRGELLFQFAQPQTSFQISDLPRDFSNYRAYLGSVGAGPVAPVPEPAEWALLLSGLGVVGAVARRRKAAARG